MTRPSISIGSCANEKSFGVAPFAGFTATMAESDFSCPCRLLALPMPAATLSTNTQPRRPNTRSPSFRCDPFARVVALDPGRASAPRNDGAAHVAFERMKTLGPCDINLSRLNPTPHAIAVYASQPLSPVTTQHSLPSGRYALLGPDFHRLDRTSLRLAHSFNHLVGRGKHTRRYFQAACFGSLDVEHGFVFRRSPHREVGWFLAFQDPVAT